MATIRGVTVIYGTEQLTGFIVEGHDNDKSAENLAIENEQGDIVSDITGIGEKHEHKLDLIVTDENEIPNVNDILSYDTNSFVVDKVGKARRKKDVMKVRVEGHSYPNVSLS